VRIGKTTPSHGFASPTIPGNTNWRQKRSLTPAATATLGFFAGSFDAYTANNGAVNLGTLGTRFGGIAPEADASSETVAEAIQRAKARGVHPISKDRSIIARLPLSGDVVAYLASEDYDPRDVRSLSRRRDRWARAGLDLSGNSEGVAGLGKRLSGVDRAGIRQPARAGISTASSRSHGST